nr:hypothetical protein [Nitrospirota bacterium]
MTRVATWILLLTALTGCSGLTSRPWFGGDSRGYWLPLTVNLQLDPTVTSAAFDYTNACQQPVTLAFGEKLTKAVTREVGMAFEHVLDGQTKSTGKELPDGTVQVVLGLKDLQLFIPRHETNSYTAAVVLGGTATYLDGSGVVYSKSIRTEAQGNVETERGSCDVQGLDGLVAKAAAALAQGFKTHLGSSSQIRQAAADRKQRGGPPVAIAGVPTQTQPITQASVQPSALSFRAMLRDESQDNVLEGAERVTVDVEVNNAGPDVARGVVVALRGTPALIQMLQNPIPVGDLQPGESKHVTVSGNLPQVPAVQQAELIVSVEAPGGSTGLLRPKKFLVALRPAKPESVEVLSVDVDQVPMPVRGYERKKAVALAIGVGNFREPAMPGVKYAARDAEVMANYFKAVGGMPAKRVKVLTDEHALKDDLVEAFEDWLPQQAEAGGVALVFFSGRAQVDPATGSVVLLPHEGNVGAPLKGFSLRRLQTALANLPVQHAVVLLDVTLALSPGAVLPDGRTDGVDPVWGTPEVLDGKLVQMIGVSRSQFTHQYEQGKHGLFTYFLLKGLAGAADRDHNGTVAVGELFEYAQRQVSMTAKADFGNEQDPACVPALVPTSKAWNLPLTRVK